MYINYLTNPDFIDLEHFIKAIPYNFDKTGVVLKNNRNEIRIVELNGIKVVIKSFKKITIANRIIYRFFRKSKAQRAYEYGLTLENKEIKTPHPIGYIDQFSSFKLKSSYFISLFVEHNPVSEVIKEATAEKELIINDLAQFIFKIHSKHIFHGDLNLGNVLYEKKENSNQFYLIDNNRMSFKKPTLSRRIDNLRRINLPVRQYMIMMAEYTKSLKNPHYTIRKILCSREQQQIFNSVKKYFKNVTSILFR